MDLPNNADIELSPAENLQVITIHNYVCCTGVLCAWVKLLKEICRYGAVNYTKMRLAPEFSPDPLGEL